MQTPPEQPSMGERAKEAVKDTFTQPLHIPFSNKADAQGHSVNATRLIEAILIAALTSLVTYVTSIPKLEEKVNNQSAEIAEMKKTLNEIQHDFYTPFGRGTPTQGRP